MTQVDWLLHIQGVYLSVLVVLGVGAVFVVLVLVAITVMFDGKER